jgi:hypothetical protein
MISGGKLYHKSELYGGSSAQMRGLYEITTEYSKSIIVLKGELYYAHTLRYIHNT